MGVLERGTAAPMHVHVICMGTTAWAPRACAPGPTHALPTLASSGRTWNVGAVVAIVGTANAFGTGTKS
jgi:hypothetical protein